MYVCLCADKSEDQIKEHIKSGSTDVETLMKETEICTGCGCCRNMVEQILADEVKG